ncbi:glycosyltransferase [methane-oxidizing endosymbiont of Gigantopelta aegis]|uniref:glycosyltransferase n=1 Tax=methane-oxidizing endosymbiont of Gigantopelta aegis TaxID=2794938 RepID=UPI0018DB6F0B|nr:glycosyltransferase [methane-oxidizing endosymbiont of Gigantopelta aegis]
MPYKLTVVICTHNRSTLLLRVITSLNNAIFPYNASVSILVIANACTDDTVIQLKRYQSIQNKKNLPLVFHEEPKPGKSNALNTAINMIGEGFMCFVDDDHRVDKNYFSAIISSIETYPKVKLFCGKIIPDWSGHEPDWIHDQGKYKIYPLPIPHFELGPHPVPVVQNMKLPGGGNLIVKRDVFNQVGVFSTKLGPQGHNLSGSEDSDFILRVLNAKMAIQYNPDIIQYHYVDEERLKFNYLIRKSFQRSRSLIKAKHPGSHPIPLYLWRKLFNYSFSLLFSFNLQRSRFYAMRIASTLGEIVGLKEN